MRIVYVPRDSEYGIVMIESKPYKKMRTINGVATMIEGRTLNNVILEDGRIVALGDDELYDDDRTRRFNSEIG